MKVGLVFLDGHADFHTPETSTSGEPADMELAVLTGRDPERITWIAGKAPLLKEEDVVVYGIRAWDQIDAPNIRVYSRKLMAESGIVVPWQKELRTSLAEVFLSGSILMLMC